MQTEESKVEPGKRYDAGKLRWDLVPPEFERVVEVYTIGAAKYSDRNWEKGMSWSRCIGSLFRHIWRWWAYRETHDAETGCHHMAMAAWNCMALLTYDIRGVGTDDRVKL